MALVLILLALIAFIVLSTTRLKLHPFLALLAVVWLLVVLVRLVLRLLGSSGRVVNPWSRYNRRRRVQMAE
ncbi:hypothetical protein ACM6PT_35650, partial [Klebsiella pneumoniae]